MDNSSKTACNAGILAQQVGNCPRWDEGKYRGVSQMARRRRRSAPIVSAVKPGNDESVKVRTRPRQDPRVGERQ
jgi:hypothetical protein